MAEQTNLPRADPAPVEYIEDLEDEFKKWLSNLVDQMNAAWQQIDDVLHVGQYEVTTAGTAFDIPIPGVTQFSLATAFAVKVINAATILTIAPFTDKITVTFDIDPGVGSFVNYTVLVAEQV